MEHELFKPGGIEEGMHSVVGNCNGISMEDRWKAETPVFAREIIKQCPEGGRILDYGCGVGRLAKEVLKMRPDVHVVGVDASSEMIEQAKAYVQSDGFSCCKPEELSFPAESFDVIYCIYVLQHVPAIEIRSALQRMHFYLKSSGKFIYCSSDYRMAIRFDSPVFFDDRHLGVDLRNEISRFFTNREELFSERIYRSNRVVKSIIRGALPHPALLYDKKSEGNKPLFDYEPEDRE